MVCYHAHWENEMLCYTKRLKKMLHVTYIHRRKMFKKRKIFGFSNIYISQGSKLISWSQRGGGVTPLDSWIGMGCRYGQILWRKDP